MDAPAGLGVGGAFDWYREQGERRLLGVSPGTLIADAETASLLAVFTHKEIWAWAHDQSQAVLGWQPLPFLDGSRAHLLWTDLTDLGGIVGAVVRIGTPRTHDDAGAQLVDHGHLDDVYPGRSETARLIRGRLETLLQRPLSLRLRGAPGVGKDFLANQLLDHIPSGRLDPLVVRGQSAATHPVWATRLAEAVERGRPVLFRDLDQVPEPRIHTLLRPLATAREQRVPVIATQVTRMSDFAERTWGKVFTNALSLPDLDAHPEDIPDITASIWRTHFGHRARLWLSREAIRQLMDSAWVGNVAELESVLLDARRRTGMDRLEASSLRVPTQRSASTLRLEDLERTAITEAMQRVDGNRTAAATLLGISRSTLYRKLDQLGL